MKRNPGNFAIKAQVQGVGTDTTDFQAKWELMMKKCGATIVSTLTKHLYKTATALNDKIRRHQEVFINNFKTSGMTEENAKMHLNQIAVKADKRLEIERKQIKKDN